MSFKLPLTIWIALTTLGNPTQAATVTASSVDASAGNLAQAAGPLGALGPLGAFGPLATLGPIGNNSWNVTKVMATLPDWSKLSQTMTLNGGPLSDDGPLGSQGPFSKYEQLADWGTLGRQLQVGGALTALGPLGPLGPFGPLGPLGPIGGHGLKHDSHGNYLDSEERVQRQIEVGNAQKTKYELFEIYDAPVAKQLKDNDTSFMVTGLMSSSKETESFQFHSQSDQSVTVIVVPEKSLDAFSLTLTDSNGKVLARSASFFLVNWIQTQVKRGERLNADVELLASGHFLRKNFRLIVVGSGPGFGY